METNLLNKMKTGRGFIAALDQSGGSTPKALKLYGVEESAYSTDEEMFKIMHAMRARIMMSPEFNSENILGAILFKQTLDREVDGKLTARYLLDKGILPFLKVDDGLADVVNDVKLMKDINGLDNLLSAARDAGVFGTKMRSVIMGANPEGIKEVVEQQFEVADKILSYGLIPIVEPEVDINIPDKQEAEVILKKEIEAKLATLKDDQVVMLKLTLPTQDDFYADLVNNPKVLRVVALSGGYERDDANAKLSRNHGVIASFSRALTEGLNVNQTDAEFDEMLGNTIKGIADASNT